MSKVMWWIWPGNSSGNFRQEVVNTEEIVCSNRKYRLWNQSWLKISTLPLLDHVILGELFISFGVFFFIWFLLPDKMGLLFPHLLQFCFHLPDSYLFIHYFLWHFVLGLFLSNYVTGCFVFWPGLKVSILTNMLSFIPFSLVSFLLNFGFFPFLW